MLRENYDDDVIINLKENDEEIYKTINAIEELLVLSKAK